MIIRNGLVFREDGTFRREDLFVENHKIVTCEEAVTDRTEIDAEGLLCVAVLRIVSFLLWKIGYI